MELNRPFLHCHQLTFPRSHDEQTITVKAPLPEDLTSLLLTLQFSSADLHLVIHHEFTGGYAKKNDKFRHRVINTVIIGSACPFQPDHQELDTGSLSSNQG